MVGYVADLKDGAQQGHFRSLEVHKAGNQKRVVAADAVFDRLRHDRFAFLVSNAV